MGEDKNIDRVFREYAGLVVLYLERYPLVEEELLFEIGASCYERGDEERLSNEVNTLKEILNPKHDN